MHNPFLVADSIYLRTIEETDLNENYQKWFNDAEVCEFNSHHRFPMYLQNLQEYYDGVIKSRDNLVLAIIDKATNTHVGNIALQSISTIDRSAELAIIVGNKEYWGKGVGYEASKLLITHGFNDLNLHRIYCGTSEVNVGMQKLATKLGFKNEGVAREALFKDGIYQNIINYGLLKHEHKK